MRRLLLPLVMCTAAGVSAAPSVTYFAPSHGVSFMQTTVQIYGTELAPGTRSCDPQRPAECPVRVFFGEQAGRVVRVTPERITVLAPPQAQGVTVNVRVELANGTQLTASQTFAYSGVDGPRREDYRIFLVPLRTGDVHGANGSLWRTEAIVHNGQEQDVLLLANNCDYPLRTPFCAHTFIPVRPDESVSLPLEQGLARLEGTFLYVPNALADRVDAKVRVRDVSRQSESFGTEVPVVRLDEFKASVRLVDVPVDPRYRSMLRIYGDSEMERLVTVTVYPMSGSDPIEQRSLTLALGDELELDPEFPFVAAYARLDPITDVVRASGHSRVRVHVDLWDLPRLDPPRIMRVWAFLSVTNNETQQVTTITPHR